MSKRPVLALCAAILPLLVARAAPATAPELLNFDELVMLLVTDQPALPLQEKLDHLLTTPFLSNQAALAGTQPHRPSVNGLGPVVRVAPWNIERGLNFDLIQLAFYDPGRFEHAARQRGELDPNTICRKSSGNWGLCATPISSC